MPDRTNSVAAAEELLKRRSTRKSLAEWARHKGFEPAKHHQLIISEIESFLAGDDEVLLLFAPPGSAKSTYVSVLLPSWYLANNPTHSILAATHSVEFAERWGRRVRNDIAADENVLGIKLSEDSKAAARWSLEAEENITAWVLAQASQAFVQTSALVMICSVLARTPTARPSDRSDGIGIKTTSARD